MKQQNKIQKKDGRLISVTGTPGTGKSLACALIKNYFVIDLNALIRKNARKFAFDSDRESIEVSAMELEKLLPKIESDIIVEGHLSHLLRPDISIVLRCSPNELGKRLRKRGWNEAKIRENQEAEAVDVILIEALSRKRSSVFEIDTTHMKPKDVAKSIQDIIEGRDVERFKPGSIDWSGEVLGWY